MMNGLIVIWIIEVFGDLKFSVMGNKGNKGIREIGV